MWKRKLLDMATRSDPALTVEALLSEKERKHAWLSRASGVPYKRVLAEVKHRRVPMLATNAALYADALGVEVEDLFPRVEEEAA
jgi:hypothetical protein